MLKLFKHLTRIKSIYEKRAEISDVIAYTMEYKGEIIHSDLTLIPFEKKYYETYRAIYNDCFYKMRKSLGLKPYNACDSIEKLLSKKDDIFLLIINEKLVGSVAVYGNEIDDLIVSKEFQNKGYGGKLLNFAVCLCQTRNMSQITLGVAKWNQRAISLYKSNGFIVSKIKTVTV